MSYARFSSDDWRSDVYCYESNSGFELNIATNRYEDLDSVPRVDWDNFQESYVSQMNAIKNRNHVPIGLPFDGEHYTFGTLEELRDKLLELREVGYNVPQFALDSIEEEMADGTE